MKILRNSMSVRRRPSRILLPLLAAPALTGCAAVGSMMSPYSERFSCKNDDHGQCINPVQAYDDAVAGASSRSDPQVTNDRSLLRGAAGMSSGQSRQAVNRQAYGSYRDSVYRELQGLIEAPVTPMLKPPRTVRTLILPYADRERPDRLYMPRFVYSVIDRPVWVIGSALFASPKRTDTTRVLEQARDGKPAEGSDAPALSPAGGEVRP